MSVPVIEKYPFDPTGEALTNLIVGEVHHVPRSQNRAFSLYEGPFYADSVVITAIPSNLSLVKDVDFECLYLYESLTLELNKEITSVINIKNPAIEGDLLIDRYQVVGGPYQQSVNTIIDLVNRLSTGNRTVYWDNIEGKPETYPPSYHTHSVDDLYGFNTLVEAINRLTDMILNGDSTSIAIFSQQVQAMQVVLNTHSNQIQLLQQEISLLKDRVYALENPL